MSIKSTNEQNKELFLTIYSNMALVNELRELPKIKDMKENNLIEYYDVSQLLIESSVMIIGSNPYEITFNYDSSKITKLNEDDIVFYESKNNFISSMFIELKNFKSRFLRTYYMTKGLNWSGSYVFILKEDVLSLQSWINLKNTSGISYDKVNIKCVAGDINKPYDNNPLLLKANSSESTENTNNIMQSSLDDYYIYSLSDKNCLQNNTTKRISFFSANNISFRKYYEFSYNNKNANIIIEFLNSIKNNLGIALPGGIVNIYINHDENLELIGNSKMKNTSKDMEVSLDIGQSFDVICERKILDYKESNGYEYKTVEIKVTNKKDEEILVKVNYPIYGPWEIINSSEQYSKDNNGNPCFYLVIENNTSSLITFQYRIKK